MCAKVSTTADNPEDAVPDGVMVIVPSNMLSGVTVKFVLADLTLPLLGPVRVNVVAAT